MVFLTPKARRSSPSIYRYMNGLHATLDGEGKDCIKFTIGDPTEAVSPFLNDTAIIHYLKGRGFKDGLIKGEVVKKIADLLGITEEVAEAKPHNYTSFQGDADLRAKAAVHFNARHGTAFGAEHFIFTVGANGAIDLALEVLDGPLILHEPGFRLYHAQATKHHKPTVTFDTTADAFVVDGAVDGKLDRVIEEQYQKALAGRGEEDFPRGQFVFTFALTDSGNPTGRKHTRSELEAICALFSNKWKSGNVIADSLYFELAHKPEDAITLLDVAKDTEFANRIVMVDSISKADSASNDRGGYMVCADPTFAEKAANAQLAGNVHPARVSQEMVVAALGHRGKYVRANADVYAGKAAEMIGFLGESALSYGKPNGGFYSMLNLAFMKDVSLSVSTIEAAKGFLGEEAYAAHVDEFGETVGNNSFLASMELTQRTGVLSVPHLPVVENDYIRQCQEDKASRSDVLLVRIVPTLSSERLTEAAKRLCSFKELVDEKGDLPKDPPQKVGHGQASGTSHRPVDMATAK